MTTEIPKEIQEEVDALIAKIAAFQAAMGRKVAKAFRRTRSGRALLTELEQFGLPIPADYRAMHQNFNGADPGATMSWHQMAVFLDYQWPNLRSVIGVNKVCRVRETFQSPDRIWISTEENRFTDLALQPAAIAPDGQIPLVATTEALSDVTFIAFDSALCMLRTVVAAQENDLLRYNDEGRVSYPLNEIASLAASLNARQVYWTLLAENKVDFEIDEVWLAERRKEQGGKVEPAVAKLMTEAINRK